MAHFHIIVVFTILSVIITYSLSARILGIAPMPFYSHQSVFRPIWRELSLRGHQVVVMTTDPINDFTLTNLTEIDLNYTYTIYKPVNFVEFSKKSLVAILKESFSLMNDVENYQLEHPEVQALIKNDTEHFDLVLVESLLPIMFTFAERFKCPFIVISSMDVFNLLHEYVGNAADSILYPFAILPYQPPLNFFERLISIVTSVTMKGYFLNIEAYRAQLQIEKHFGKGYPQLTDIFKNVSMIFINLDPILHNVRPLVPAVVAIGGGLHINKPKPLPKDLQTYLDNATEGVIYFNLGSTVKCSYLEEHTIRVFIETFKELPYKILWKYELDNLPEKPDNVLVSKWFPQQDILRHPNVKLFITQGGLQSMEEAVYNNLPTIVIPIFGDQLINAKRMVDRGISLSLEFTTLNKKLFNEAILEVIQNETYRTSVKQLADLAKDQQTTGLERAIWWTEYVLRHKGAKHLHGPGIDMPFYQYYLWDIIAFSLLIITVVIILIKFIVKVIASLIKMILTKFKQKLE